jgi:hypothetical protein
MSSRTINNFLDHDCGFNHVHFWWRINKRIFAMLVWLLQERTFIVYHDPVLVDKYQKKERVEKLHQ